MLILLDKWVALKLIEIHIYSGKKDPWIYELFVYLGDLSIHNFFLC